MFPQSALRDSPGTGGLFICVHFPKTTWHSNHVMQMYSPIQCQWLLRLKRQAIHILINQDHRLNNVMKSGLSLREKPWFMIFNFQEKVFQLFSVRITPNKCEQQWHSCCSPLHHAPSSHTPFIKVWLILECPDQKSSLQSLSWFTHPIPSTTHYTLLAESGLLYSDRYSNRSATSVMSHSELRLWVFPTGLSPVTGSNREQIISYNSS